MNQRELVIEKLNELNIKYEEVKHKAVWTTEEADEVISGKDGVPSKTLFLAGKKDKRFYLIIMDDSKRLDLKKLGELLNDRLHFGSEKQLLDKLGLVPGMVSLFGLLNNSEHDIEIYIDKELLSENLITFHPNVNTSTLFISVNDMFKFIENIDYKYSLIEM